MKVKVEGLLMALVRWIWTFKIGNFDREGKRESSKEIWYPDSYVTEMWETSVSILAGIDDMIQSKLKGDIKLGWMAIVASLDGREQTLKAT